LAGYETEPIIMNGISPDYLNYPGGPCYMWESDLWTIILDEYVQ